jgi:hypothetical protein
VEFVIAHETAQTTVQGSVAWKWTHSIDHEPLVAGTQARVTNMLAPHLGMPTRLTVVKNAQISSDYLLYF